MNLPDQTCVNHWILTQFQQLRWRVKWFEHQGSELEPMIVVDSGFLLPCRWAVFFFDFLHSFTIFAHLAWQGRMFIYRWRSYPTWGFPLPAWNSHRRNSVPTSSELSGHTRRCNKPGLGAGSEGTTWWLSENPENEENMQTPSPLSYPDASCMLYWPTKLKLGHLWGKCHGSFGLYDRIWYHSR